MSRFRKTDHDRKVFFRAYLVSLIAASFAFGLGESFTIAQFQLTSRWPLSLSLILAFLAATQSITFILIGGPVAYILIVILDEHLSERFLAKEWGRLLVGGALGLMLSPACILPFVPFHEPDSPTYLYRWAHYSLLMIVAGAVGAFCFGRLIEKNSAFASLGRPSGYGQ